MSMRMDRNSDGAAFVLDANLKTPIIAIPGKGGGGIVAFSNFGGTGFTFEVGATRDLMVPLMDGTGSAITVAVSADQACAIPEAAMKFAQIRLCAIPSGAAQGQGVGVVFKS